jgi:hypothetical protein
MSHLPEESPHAPVAPQGIAVSGILFAMLYIVSLVLVRLAVPATPTDAGEWLANPGLRKWVGMAMNLVPFAGIAFLWFMGVLRNRIGLFEDRFFSTVFLGSGLLFVAMLFTSAAVAQGLLNAFGSESVSSEARETFRVGRGMSYSLMTTFGVRIAAVFMFVTSTIGLRTKCLSRRVSYVGFAFGTVQLIAISQFPWITLLFPLWVLLVSLYILYTDFQAGRQMSTGDQA